MSAYYNDNEPFCAQVLAANIARGRLPAGQIDVRDIRHVQPADLMGHAQLHFFAGEVSA